MKSATDYEAFIEGKRLRAPATGFDLVPALSPLLFPFQRDIVQWALRRGRAALWADCGLGKSWVALEWARVVAEYDEDDRPALILTPLAVAQQFVGEGAKMGIEVTHARDQSAINSGVNVTNYERLHRFDPSKFGAVVLDECFAPETEIDTPSGAMRIDCVRVGDRILNAAGNDTVSDVHRREVSYAVIVEVNGRKITCSPNHPFFTGRGWVGAQDLIPGDHALETGAAVRMVRTPVHAKVYGAEVRAILRSILLSEMAYATAGDCGQGPRPGCGGKTWPVSFGMVEIGGPKGNGGDRANAQHRSRAEVGRDAREDLPPIERDEARTFRAWGQRSWFDGSAEDFVGCTRTELDSGICFVTGPADSRVSNALQARSRATRAALGYRSGWKLPLREKGIGPEEGCEIGLVRVDGVEVLEQGDPRLERFRSIDGRIYFYDLGGTRHPSFSVAGCLVHNSSILKDYTSSTRNAVIQAFESCPFRLAQSATPAPNDHMELGNHAEFLGVMSRTEMLSMFFVHDGGSTQDWRLKGHAVREFWRWVCSWAVAIRAPSDLGYSDEGFILPPMALTERVVSVGTDFARSQGTLFAVEARGLSEQRDARKSSLADRVKVAAEIVNAEPTEPWLIWCDLNAESEALTAAIPGAVEITGSDSEEKKETAMAGFTAGTIRAVVTKPSIAGMGMNWQHCARVVFVGLSHSFEAWYQAIRRVYRFGQKREVKCWMISSDAEGAVVANLKRKQADAARMVSGMVAEMAEFANVKAATRDMTDYKPTKKMTIPKWVGAEGR